MLIMYPTSLAVIALTFSNYVLQPVFPNCIPPYNASRILSMVCLREYFLLAYTKLASVLHKTAQGTAPAGLGIQPRCMGAQVQPKKQTERSQNRHCAPCGTFSPSSPACKEQVLGSSPNAGVPPPKPLPVLFYIHKYKYVGSADRHRLCINYLQCWQE